MRVVDMQVMLHWYYRRDAYPDRSSGGAMSARVKESHSLLQSQGMLKRGPDCAGTCIPDQRFEATYKGRCYVRALELVQLPVQRWEVPA